LDTRGGEVSVGHVRPGAPMTQGTYTGHAFRAYAVIAERRRLLREYVAVAAPVRQQVVVVSCGPVGAWLQLGRPGHVSRGMERAEEFAALAHEGECAPAGRSGAWSCVRYWPPAACAARHRNEPRFAGKDTFGYPTAQGRYPAGTIEIDEFIPKVPRVSSGPGFLKMNMTGLMRQVLPWWYQQQVARAAQKPEAEDAGDRFNDDVVQNGFVDVRTAAGVRAVVEDEMHQVLEWWLGGSTRLEHKGTYGVRVYPRGRVMIHHTDRPAMLASAIIQVSQRVDEDGGWPLEIITDVGGCHEVFMQPGEMVLYEGAAFKHGRPMVFRGDEFANLLIHFAPEGWSGSRQDL